MKDLFRETVSLLSALTAEATITRRVGCQRQGKQAPCSLQARASAPSKRRRPAISNSGRLQPRGALTLSSAVHAAHPSWGAEPPSVERSSTMWRHSPPHSYTGVAPKARGTPRVNRLYIYILRTNIFYFAAAKNFLFSMLEHRGQDYRSVFSRKRS